MNIAPRGALPILRLAVYVVIFGACGAVAAHEAYYWLAGTRTTAPVVAVSKTGPTTHALRYAADYEFLDLGQVRHTGHTDNALPTTNFGDEIEVQYLRHDPRTSRLAPSPAAGLCYGAVALLAGITFVAEWVVRRRRRLCGSSDSRS